MFVVKANTEANTHLSSPKPMQGHWAPSDVHCGSQPFAHMHIFLHCTRFPERTVLSQQSLSIRWRSVLP